MKRVIGSIIGVSFDSFGVTVFSMKGVLWSAWLAAGGLPSSPVLTFPGYRRNM